MPVDQAQHLAQRTTEKVEAVAAIKAALAALGESPDAWQRLYLAQAISWLWRGAYQLAAVNAGLAVTPAHEHVPVTDPAIDSYTPEALRSALVALEAEPVRPFVAFGEIKYTG